ncbi:AAA-associated domain-containing protein [Streptomyces hokutonensis]|uniref:AAA-associated domain-containing protein n=1 Tax=Streptomyces hokutonensis TaxID=1306990 RepID=UPI0036AB35D2
MESDEPFSALDVLTAENLRGELTGLWESGRLPTRTIALVTHSVEEAALLADRIVVLGARPCGTIREVGLHRPRDRDAAASADLIDRAHRTVTGRQNAGHTHGRTGPVELEKRTPANTPLPTATSVDGLSGRAETVVHHEVRADLAGRAEDLGLEIDDILPLLDALDMLGFTAAHSDDLLLTDTEFAGADAQKSKSIFAEAARGVPLVRLITRSRRQNPDGTLRGFLRDVLAHHFTGEQAIRRLESVTDGGRHAEPYSYDGEPQVYCDRTRARDARPRGRGRKGRLVVKTPRGGISAVVRPWSRRRSRRRPQSARDRKAVCRSARGERNE